MKQRTKNIIAGHIRDVILSGYAEGSWKERRKDILTAIAKLQPDKPDDKTTNFIAFNVPNKDKRLKLKTGRFLSRKLSLNSGFLDDKTLQTLSDAINMELFGVCDDNIKLVNGADITARYKRSFGSGSCMCDDASRFTKLYEDNPIRFQMLTMEFGGDKARAIVHKLDSGEYLMDRVYGSSSSITDSMRDFAISNNWSYCVGSNVCFDGNEISDYSVCVVSDLNFTKGEVPYMDTLTSGKVDDGKLTIFHNRAAGLYSDHTLDSTCGCLDGGDVCYICEDQVGEDEANWWDDHCYCNSCYEDRFTYCEQCDGTVLVEDIVYVHDKEVHVCHDCAVSNYTECEDCGHWHENSYYIEGEDKRVCDNCVDSYVLCEKCDQYYKNSDVHTVNDDEYVCEDCRDEHFTQCAECDEWFPGEDTIENDDGDMICDGCNAETERAETERAGQTHLFDGDKT